MSRGFGIAGLYIYTSDPTIKGANPSPYIITDHNRSPIQISYDRIENSARMANGTMRRFITANKKRISTSWNMLPAAGGYNFTADGNLGAAWLKSFFEENVYNPIWIRLTYAEEAWRFGASDKVDVNRIGINPSNYTYNATPNNLLIPNTQQVASVAYSTFSNGVATASVTTIVSPNVNKGDVVVISGVNQLFNGSWVVKDIMPSSQTVVFMFNDVSGFGSASATNNPSATFKINSYVKTGSSATFNVDNSDFLKVNASVVISNSKNNIGNSINGTWQITGKPSQTSFTASSTVGSFQGAGQYGDVAILSSSSYSGSISSLTPYITGPAISSDIMKVFITNFTYNINKRLAAIDYVDVSMEFTEI